MRENYKIKIHNMNTNRIHVYKIFATSFENACLQAKCYIIINVCSKRKCRIIITHKKTKQ